MIEKNINIKDIPDQFQYVAKEIGVDNFVIICKLLGGTLTYIPSLKTIEKNSRNEEIIKEFDGANYKYLSIKYKMSEQYIRKLINKARSTKL